ncbi:OLC1v1017724C2 [Oldenlandia corymbosa var. corymbosa]|uniref:Exocyst complex component SEC5 n=1 Tax=Oldenlandia corymbosa var. corymbosa TaxID=529605 RepID=A0AAV1EA52_OLDCO|nr:OLC1v1017724C2 [Oldenlandia corymbosa var. corymbosa]
MSSDSDDEDELLQMALKEQAERDLNYRKPSQQQPSKPVRNYVQPPAPRRGGGTPARNSNSSAAAVQQKKSGSSNSDRSRINHQQQQQRKVVEDDDDSEVEMLSISSGDEEFSSKDRAKYGAGSKGRAASGGGRGGRDDDKGWDGGEPDCWKHVDESELGRRVREMRESRAVPLVPKIEAAALAKKGLSSLQSLPRGMEWIDPLGLGIIDHKTFRLMSDSGPVPSLIEKEPLDANAREKLNYYSEKFDAKLFLSRVHYDTTAANLEAGGLALKTDLKGRTQAKKQLVKENFDCFVSCKTTIDDIESKLKRIEDDPEGSGTTHLFNCIQGVNSIANRAFESLFERQAQAEKIRSVQGMLQRFRTLFNLPSTIRGNISKGEYDLAVREYRKAKSIVLPSHVGILKRVLEEVEKVMQEFKAMLYKSMEDPHIELTNLENIVRLLVELEPDSDPVWHYLSMQNRRIRGLLEKCTVDHDMRMEALRNETREKALLDAKWKRIQADLNQSLDVDDSHAFGAQLPEDLHSLGQTGEEVDALRGRYIRRLTAVLIHHVPAFWKVALSVSTGKFAKSSQVSSDSSATAHGNKTEEKVADGKITSHSLDEVAGMIQDTLSAYESKVLSTFRGLEESNVLCPSIIGSIKEISKACQAFEVKESAPSVAVVALRTLQCEITKIYILRLCSWMRLSSEEISRDESWVPVSILERNKSPYTISSLPLAFRAIIVSAMDQIDQMIQSLRNEAAKSEDIYVHLQRIQESVRLAFLNCLLGFAGHLEQLGSELNQTKSTKESPMYQNGYSHEFQEKPFDPLPGSVTDPHQQLLMVLSNIGYCKDELARELHRKYRHIWLTSREKDEDTDMQDLIMSFSGLEEKVLELYTLPKTNLIRTAAVSYLLDAGIQWGAAPAVKGVRDATVELLHTLVAVHAEVFAGCKPLLDKTLGILVEGLIDTLLSLFHENETKELRALDANGFCQLMLELEYFETILNPYFTSEARESLKSLQGDLLEKATESVSETIETPSHQRRPTRGSDDVLADERQGMSVSPDDLLALAQQYSSELLQTELERTRINTACFVESIPLDSVPESAKVAYASFRGSMDSPSFRGMDSPSSRSYKSSQSFGSPSFSRHRRR